MKDMYVSIRHNRGSCKDCKQDCEYAGRSYYGHTSKEEARNRACNCMNYRV